MRNAIVIGLGLVIAAVVLAQSGEPVVLGTANPNKVQPVNVLNFPDPQNVAGTVDVGNLPAVQQVAGTVAVSSLPPLPQPARFHLVGFTAAELTGNQGVFTFTAACQLEYPGSRMCMLSEAIKTVVIPDLAAGTDIVWIEPGEGRSAITSVDGNCEGWRAISSYRGMTIDKQGGFVARPCDFLYGVACCAS